MLELKMNFAEFVRNFIFHFIFFNRVLIAAQPAASRGHRRRDAARCALRRQKQADAGLADRTKSRQIKTNFAGRRISAVWTATIATKYSFCSISIFSRSTRFSYFCTTQFSKFHYYVSPSIPKDLK